MNKYLNIILWNIMLLWQIFHQYISAYIIRYFRLSKGEIIDIHISFWKIDIYSQDSMQTIINFNLIPIIIAILINIIAISVKTKKKKV